MPKHSRGASSEQEIIQKVGNNLDVLVKKIVAKEQLGIIRGQVNSKDIKNSIVQILTRLARDSGYSPAQEEELLNNSGLKNQLFTMIKSAVLQEKEKRIRAYQLIDEWLAEIEQKTERSLQQLQQAYQASQAGKDVEAQQKKKREEEIQKLQAKLQALQQRVQQKRTQLAALHQTYAANVAQLEAVLQEGFAAMEEVGLGLVHILPDQMTDFMLNPGELIEQLTLLGAHEAANTVQQQQDSDQSFDARLQALLLLDRCRAFAATSDLLPDHIQTLQEEVEADFTRNVNPQIVPAEPVAAAVIEKFNKFLVEARQRDREINESLRQIQEASRELEVMQGEYKNLNQEISDRAQEDALINKYVKPEQQEEIAQGYQRLAEDLGISPEYELAMNQQPAPYSTTTAPVSSNTASFHKVSKVPADDKLYQPQPDETQEQKQEYQRPMGNGSTGGN